MKPRRIERLAEFIKERVAQIVQRDIADPRLGLVTITRVELDREMETCKVFWSVLGDEKDRKLNEHALAQATGYVQRQVAASLHTRTTPRVRFVHDPSIEGAIRVNATIKRLAEERRAHGEDEGLDEPAAGDDPPADPAASEDAADDDETAPAS